jgi:hypothetical protein
VPESRAWQLVEEVEVFSEVTELGHGLAHGRSRVGPTVGGGVETGTAKEVVFDELEVRVVAQGLVLDEPLLGVRRDDERGSSQPVAVGCMVQPSAAGDMKTPTSGPPVGSVSRRCKYIFFVNLPASYWALTSACRASSRARSAAPTSASSR